MRARALLPPLLPPRTVIYERKGEREREEGRKGKRER